MARPQKATPMLPAAPIDEEKIGTAMDALRDQTITTRSDEDTQLAQASQIVGGALMANLHKKFSAAAEVSMFMQLRELPLAVIRKIPISRPGEPSATAENLPELCKAVFGRPYNTLAEEAQNFQALGEASYDVASRLGLNRSALRAARALPPEKLELVRAAITDGSTKAEVLTVIEDLAVQVEQANTTITDLRESLKADEQVRGDLRKRIDKLERDKKRIKAEAPDETLAALVKETQSEALAVLGTLRGTFASALQALDNHTATYGGNVTVTMAAMVGQLQAELAALREAHGLPDVSSAADAELAAQVAQWAGDGAGAAH